MDDIGTYLGTILTRSTLRSLRDIIVGEVTPEDTVDLVVSIRDSDIYAHDLATYISFADRVYGRTKPDGFRSYAHSLDARLKISAIRAGSAEIVFAFSAPELLLSSGAFLLTFVLTMAKAYRTWGEGYKAHGEGIKSREEARSLAAERQARSVSQSDTGRSETALPLLPVAQERFGLSEVQAPDRNQLRAALDASAPGLRSLTKRQRSQVITAVETLLASEWRKLAAVSRFDATSVNHVSLHRRSRGGTDE